MISDDFQGFHLELYMSKEILDLQKIIFSNFLGQKR